MVDDEEEKQPKTCDVCGSELQWVDCWMCGGDGEYDETETDPLEGDQFAVCPECYGKGGYLECTELPHHTDDEP